MHDPSIRIAKLRRMAGRLPVGTGASPAGLGLTSFAVDHRRLQELDELIDDYGVAEDHKAEWPNNMLSKRTVIYENGAFARTRYKPRFDVDQDELALCKRVSMAAKAIVGDKYLGLGDASDHPFVPFFIAANTFDPRPTVIDSDFIKDRFAQTLFPPFTIKVEPLSMHADWWREVEEWCTNVTNSGHRVHDMDLAV